MWLKPHLILNFDAVKYIQLKETTVKIKSLATDTY